MAIGITSTYLAFAPADVSATSTPYPERFYPVITRKENKRIFPRQIKPIFLDAKPFNPLDRSPADKSPLELITPDTELPNPRDLLYKPSLKKSNKKN